MVLPLLQTISINDESFLIDADTIITILIIAVLVAAFVYLWQRIR